MGSKRSIPAVGAGSHIPLTIGERLSKYFKRNYFFLLLLLPGTVFIILFYYLPYYGLAMAFEHFTIGRGVFHSPFVGFQNFYNFFSSIYFFRIIRNTVVLSFLTTLFGYPAPIIFALLLNEVRKAAFKRTIQTISYLPHFISTVILVGLIYTMFSPSNGILTLLIQTITGQKIAILGTSAWFRPLFVGLGIYGSYGWDSIIFLAALSSVDPTLYEAARIDGANRWQQMLHVTLPSILAPIIILFILRLGGIFSVGFETVYLLSNAAIYDVADVV